jgi:hypothetical protein
MRQHPNESAVLKYPVMHERCAGVDGRENHRCMGQDFVHLFHKSTTCRLASLSLNTTSNPDILFFRYTLQ